MTLGNCLFGPVRLIKNSDLINIDIVVMVLGSMRVHNFHYLAVAGAVIIFGVDNSFSVHVDNKEKNALVPDVGPIMEI